MLDAPNQADPCRDLAEECRRLATSTLSSRMKERYLLMAKDYILLADVMEQARVYCVRPVPRTPELLA